jgi:hypothetical protein
VLRPIYEEKLGEISNVLLRSALVLLDLLIDVSGTKHSS